MAPYGGCGGMRGEAPKMVQMLGLPPYNSRKRFLSTFNFYAVHHDVMAVKNN
jgi:hypothetical protein